MNEILSNKISNLPNHPGVYLMRDAANKIIYIGKATSLIKRVRSYFVVSESKSDTCEYSHLIRDNSRFVKTIKTIDYILTNNVNDALLLEESLIKRFQPKYNVMWKDDKHYPYIEITNEKFPSLKIVRRKKADGGSFFGPYPDVSDMKHTLRFIYKTFSPRRCKYDLNKRNKECLYYFINKCPAPCIDKISEKKYAGIVNNIKMFLKGKDEELSKKLEKKMEIAKNNLDFEKAAELRDTIFAIKNTVKKVSFKEIKIEDILLNVDSGDYLSELSQLVGSEIHRIEGFDISNISGKYACGSMVVFEQGTPKKSDYRKFKIKTVEGANDCAMIGEIMKRRFSGKLSLTTAVPELIVIDGGKGQLTSVLVELEKCFSISNMPRVVAIAKQNEELFFPKNPNPVVLSKNSLALNLIKYVCNEAHRFAVAYHRVLRRAAVSRV